MSEIVRLTSQKQPLEVGLPLYPFSHTTLFATSTLPESAQMVPLPDPSTSHSMEYDSQSFVQDPVYRRIAGNASITPAWGPSEQSLPQGGGWNYHP